MNHPDDPLAEMVTTLATIDPALGEQWRLLAEAPRYQVLEDPDDRFAVALILIPAANANATPEERLLHAIFVLSRCVLAVERRTRRLYHATADRATQRLIEAARAGNASARHAWSARSLKMKRLSSGSLDLRDDGLAFQYILNGHWAAGHRLIEQARQKHPTREARLPARLSRLLRRHETEHMRAARAALLRHFDRRAWRQVQGQDLAQYHWLNQSDPRRRHRREQALAAYPLLVGWPIRAATFLTTANTPAHQPIIGDRDGAPQPLSPTARLTQVIDSGQPLVPILAELFGVRAEVVRRLRLVRPSVCQAMIHSTFRHAIHLLGTLPPEKRPTNREAWRCYRNVVGEIRTWGLQLDWHGAERAAVHAARQRFLRKLANRGWAPGWRHWQVGFHWTASLGDAGDLWEALRHLVGLDDHDEPEREDIAPHLGALAQWIAERGPESLRDLSEAWHAALLRHQSEDLPAERSGVSRWPALTKPFMHRDLVVMPIDDSDKLNAAARTLHNCAALYTRHCLFGRVHLVTLARPGGRPLSMAELRIQSRARRRTQIEVVQHTGPRNGSPTAACVEALKAYVDAIDRGELRVDHEGLEAALSTRLANREHMERDNDAATQAQRMYALRQALPPEAWGLLDGKTLSGRTDAGMSDTDTEGKCSMAPMLSVGGEADG